MFPKRDLKWSSYENKQLWAMRCHGLSKYHVFFIWITVKIGQISSEFLISNLYVEVYFGPNKTHIPLNHKMVPTKIWRLQSEDKLYLAWPPITIFLCAQYIRKKTWQTYYFTRGCQNFRGDPFWQRRNSRSKVFCEIGVLKYFTKFAKRNTHVSQFIF